MKVPCQESVYLVTTEVACGPVCMIPSIWEGWEPLHMFWATLIPGTHLLLPQPSGAELTMGLLKDVTLSRRKHFYFSGPCCLPKVLPRRAGGVWVPAAPRSQISSGTWPFPRTQPRHRASTSLSRGIFLVGGMWLLLRILFPWF